MDDLHEQRKKQRDIWLQKLQSGCLQIPFIQKSNLKHASYMDRIQAHIPSHLLPPEGYDHGYELLEGHTNAAFANIRQRHGF